jgi:hypothetical protein
VPRTACLFLLLALPLAGHALCTSDDVPPSAALLERFISADCAECWRDRATPQPGKDTLVLDWVVPGLKGENAPLSAVASLDAMERLRYLKEPTPQRSSSVSSRRQGDLAPLRLAQGQAFNDYVGTSMELKEHANDAWRAWLLLVEKLPAGTEGSPVARNLVRNVFRPEWANTVGRGAGRLAETRAMQIHHGANPERLRLVAVLQDGRGRIRAITQTECP